MSIANLFTNNFETVYVRNLHADNSYLTNLNTTNISSGSAVITDTTESTSASTGALVVNGGAGVHGNLTTGGVAYVNSLVSNSGVINGRVVPGGLWYKIYTLSSLFDDKFSINVTTKDTGSNILAAISLNAALNFATTSMSFQHENLSGNAINFPRIAAFGSTGPGAVLDTYQHQNNGSLTCGVGYLPIQSFRSVTGNPITAMKIIFDGSTTNTFDIAICPGTHYSVSSIIGVSSPAQYYAGGINPLYFFFTTPVPMISGDQYVFAIRPTISQAFSYSVSIYSGYPYGNYGIYNISTQSETYDLNRTLVFDIWGLGTSTIADIYLYAQPEYSSTSVATITNHISQPLWTADGSGTWPDSYPGGSPLYDTQTNAPSMSKYFGSTGCSSLTCDGVASITNTTESTSTSTGSIKTLGGLGVAKNIYCGGLFDVTGQLVSHNTTESTSTSTGSIRTLGGIGAAKNIYCGGLFDVTGELISHNVTDVTAPNTGSIHTPGGIYAAKNIHTAAFLTAEDQLFATCTKPCVSLSTGSIICSGGVAINGDIVMSGKISVQATQSSSSPTTGAIVLAGGLGVGEKIFCAGSVNVLSTDASTSLTTGSIIASGGCGIAHNLYVGGDIHGISTTQSTSTATGAVVTAGGVGVAKDLYVGGDIHGTNTTASSSISTGSIISSGGAGIAGNLYAGGTINGIDTTQSTSTATGSVVTAGGVGMAKDLYVGGDIHGTNTTASSSISTGAIISSGGAGIAGNLYVGGTINGIDTTQSTSTATGSVVTAGGVGMAKDLYVGGDIHGTNTTASSSVSTGAIISSGGAGIAGNLYVGGTINGIDTTQSTSTATGSVVTAGGVGIAKDLYVGGTIYGSISPSFGDVYKQGNLTASSLVAGYDANHIITHTGQYTIDNTDANASKLKVNTPDNSKYTQVACDQSWNTGQLYTTAANLELWSDSTKISTLDNDSFTIEPTTQSVGIASGAFIVKGGCGIYKNMFVGNSLFYTSDTLTIPAGAGPFNDISVPNQNLITLINNSDLNANFTGFIVGAGNTNGHKIDFYCDSGNAFILKNLDAGSVASNQIKTCDAADVTLTPPCYFSLLYITTYTKWIVVAQSP